MQPLVEIRDLTIRFPEGNQSFEAVKRVSFTVQEGEIVGVVGESGSGKSMSALALMGLLKKNAQIPNGEILFRGKNLLTMKPEERKKLQGNEMAMVFQEPMTSLNPVLRIGAQVGESLRLHTDLKENEIHARVLAALEEVGLHDAEAICRKYPHELSGGMRQRVMLAQATVCSPSLIIADEPTTALDVIVQAQILSLLKKIHEEKQTAILFISHDLNVIQEICSRVIVMYQGVIVEEGETREVLQHPKHEYTKHLVASFPRAREYEGNSEAVLRLQNLNVFYEVKQGLFAKRKKKHVIHDVTLSAHDGEILGIVGESGCGKSTLCKTILGLHKDYTGTVWMKEGMRPQMVFQDPFASLNPAKTIGWLLEEPLKLRGIHDRGKRRELVSEMLTSVGLDASYGSRKARELSGGQRQRISIAMALLMEPGLIIADEPVSALDVTVQSQILKLLVKLHEERRMTILFISHDLNLVRNICRRVMVIYKGEVVEYGHAKDVYEAPAHPYTKLLLASILDGSQQKESPSLLDLGEPETFPTEFSGCGFYPRCPVRGERCKTEHPEGVALGGGHEARCFRLAET